MSQSAGAERVLVIAAVIKRGDRVLLCRRPAHKRHGGLWEFPGGKLEAGESLLHAAQRELEEELGLQATSVGDVLFGRQVPGSSRLYAGVCVFWPLLTRARKRSPRVSY